MNKEDQDDSPKRIPRPMHCWYINRQVRAGQGLHCLLIESFDIVEFIDESTFFFVCGVLRPSQPNDVMSSAVSLPNYID